MKNEIIFNNETINKRKETFLEYLDISELTLKSYRNGINCFLEYLNKKQIKNPTRIDFRGFRDELKNYVSINTINSYMTGIRAFFRYLNANGIYEDITKDVKSLKTSNTPKTQVLSQEQCTNIYRNLNDKKEKALFSLAICTALRSNEIANAKIENIQMYNGELVLFVKCKKRDDENEYVKLSSKVYQDIKDYIGNRTNGYIFISQSNNNYGGGLSTTSIRNIIKNIFKRNGIDQDWFSCHTCRRSACTIAYNLGADIVQIQQMAHHSSISTTRRYLAECTRNKNKIELKLSNAILG